jgi:5-methylcytosine-specific restriction protein A
MADWPYNTKQWSVLRRHKLALSPLCEECEDIGKLTVANTVDHVVAIKSGGAPFPGLDELRSLCPPCHGAKTARGDEAGAVHTRKPRKGCNPDGTPLDRAHPWHVKRVDKSLRADGSRPTPTTRIELVPLGPGVLDDELHSLWG